MKWFRFYSEAVNDPKVQRLPGELFKFWINLLCLANNEDNGGVLPASVDDIAWTLRLDVDTCKANLHTLQGQGLLDWQENENCYKAHNWEERQYASDDVNKRVSDWRQKKRSEHETLPKQDVTLHETLHVTPPDTEQIQIQNRTEKKGARAKAARSLPDDFAITDEMRFWAKENVPGLDIVRATEQWKDGMRSNTAKYRYTDWTAAWRNGMKRVVDWNGGNGNGNQAKDQLRADQHSGPRPLAFPKVARPGNSLRRPLEDKG